MQLLARRFQRLDLGLPLHSSLLSVQMFPAAEGRVFVVTLQTRYQRLQVTFRRHITMVKASDGCEDTLFLTVVEPDSHLLYPVLVLSVLLHDLHAEAIFVPGYT